MFLPQLSSFYFFCFSIIQPRFYGSALSSTSGEGYRRSLEQGKLEDFNKLDILCWLRIYIRARTFE